MSITRIITLINQMHADGVIEQYAVGGAVGATFYLEPIATVDVDIFVAFRQEPGQLFINPQPLLDYLVARGGALQGEYVVVAGWPVQFLPPTSPLVEEAMAEAVTVDVEGIPARVFTAEHLAAIALETGRAKDKARRFSSLRQARFERTYFRALSCGTDSAANGPNFSVRF